MRWIAVIDIGKTNAKVLVVDLTTGAEVAERRTSNAVIKADPYPHFDADRVWAFLLDALGALGALYPVEAISITTHGALAALVDAEGGLALPMLDYEHPGPDEAAAVYDPLRPDFAETGSPRLPGGLNLGAQVYWQARTFPEAFASVAHILTGPQYWAMRLTGVFASEPTSLGCHTDLWNPWKRDFSSLIPALGRATGRDWSALFPAVRPAATCLGPLLPQLATATGLPAGLPVYSGIHDSNASLVPYLAEPQPFAVVSSGTWMITMALGGAQIALSAKRDTLVNVNALGGPTPTARFMGGRAFENLTEGRIVEPDAADVAAVLKQGLMVLPSLHPETGPFPGLQMGWRGVPAGPGQACAAASFHVALMVAECLALIGAAGPTHVEGPFGANRCFARMLATASGRPVLPHGQSAGTGLGAALLAGPLVAKAEPPVPVQPEPGLAPYARAWRDLVGAEWAARGQGR